MDSKSKSQSQDTSEYAMLTTERTGETTDNYDMKDKNFFQRAFSPIHQGAMRGSIFALLASAMGTGVFNLPYRVEQIGVFFYILYLLIAGLFSYLGMYTLSRLIHRFKIESYSQMCEQAYGSGFRKFAEVCLIIYPWGITVCFQVIFAKFVLQLLADVFDMDIYELREKQQYTTTGELIRVLLNVGALALDMIFILKKQIGVLQKVSIIGVLATIFNTIVLTVTLFTGFTAPEPGCVGSHCEYGGIINLDWSKVKWFGAWDWQGLSMQMQGFASLMFCFVNHQLIFPLMYDLKNPTKRRMDKIFMRVHLTQIVAYFLVGMAGYLLLVEHTPERSINGVVLASILTPVVTFGKSLMVIALFFAVPLNLFPARQVCYESFGMEKTNKNHIMLSLILSLSGLAIAIFFTSVNSYFALLGGTAGVMMAGGFPAMCYYKTKGLRTLNQKMIVLFMILVVICGVYGAILSVAAPS